MPQLFVNNATSVLATGISAAATSLVLSAGTGARFPAPTGGDYFLLTLYQMSGNTEVNHEIVRVTSRTTDTCVIVRAQEGTTARAFNSADPVSARVTAGSFDSAALGLVKTVTATAPVASTGGLNPVISMPAATAAVDGYLTATAYSLFSGKQNALGFTPVQQGTGTNQLSNAIKIGWTAASKLALTVDVTDFGSTWPIGITGTAANVTGTVAVANGGTGQTSYAVGDLLYASGATTISKLADVATGNVLISGGVGAAPVYGKVGLTTHVSGVLPIANGGTNSTATPTAGGIGYGTGTALAYSAQGTAGHFVRSGGAGAPTMGALTSSEVTTALGYTPTSNGNTPMIYRGQVADASIDTATSPGYYERTYAGASAATLVWGIGGSTGHVQLDTMYSGQMKFRNKVDTNTWSAWRTIWHSGNMGAGSGLDADMLEGYHADTAPSFNTIARRDGAGYLEAVHFKMTTAAGTARTGDTVFYSSNNDYLYKNTKAGFLASLLGWESSLGMDGTVRTSSAPNFNADLPSGFYEYDSATGAPGAGWYSMINARHSNRTNQHGFQIAEAFGTDGLLHRRYSGGTNASNGSFQPWKLILDAANYGAYSEFKQTVGVKAGDYGVILRNDNTTAGGSTQFYIENQLGDSRVGNLRGALRLYSATGMVQIEHPRPVFIESGKVSMKGDAGGWGMGYQFIGSDWNALGGFWGWGSGNGINRWSIGMTHDTDFFSVTWDGRILMKATDAYSGYNSRLTINYEGAGSQHGITLKPGAPDTNAINFLASGSTYGAPTIWASIRHQTNGMSLTGTWRYNDNELMTLAGGTLTGPLRGKVTAIAGTALDCAQGNYFTKSVSAVTAFTFANVPAGDYSLTLEVSLTAGGAASFAGVKWPKDVTPTFTVGKTYLVFLGTSNSGTTWRGAAVEYGA